MVDIKKHRLYDTDAGSDSCGVGFITRKDGTPTHKLLQIGHDALCVVPHRGGMDAEGIGDGGGILVDLSEDFFSKCVGQPLKLGEFAVGQFFMPPNNHTLTNTAKQMFENLAAEHDLDVLLWRMVPVDITVVNEASARANPTIHQAILKTKSPTDWRTLEHTCITITEKLGEAFFPNPAYKEFYPISISSRTVVYKGRLNSNEVVSFFKDFQDPDFKIKIFLFHTRFSTNTAPRPSMAQPFSRMAHNGELNTDKKNRIHENSILKTQGKTLITPIGQSDSARMDQTLARRLRDDNLGIVEALVRMSPPAWENNNKMSDKQRDMLEFFSLDEEKVDGPAAMAFTDGIRVGCKLDRLGLRPLRQTETTEYISVMSEAGQNIFDPTDVISRGRIAAGDMVIYDHSTQQYLVNDEILEMLAERDTYSEKLRKKIVHISDLGHMDADLSNPKYPPSVVGRAVAYGHNAESFRFMVDPILENGAEKVSAMGYGVAINPLNPIEGGISRYFSQRFAQVTNPPLDSIREADGMTCRVALGAKPAFSPDTQQIILDTPILSVYDLCKIRSQSVVHVDEMAIVFKHHADDTKNAENLKIALQNIATQAVRFAKNNGIIIASDVSISATHAPIPITLAVAAINKGLVDAGLRFNTSFIMETGQVLSSHDMATTIGFGAAAVCPTMVYERANELFPNDVQGALKRYRKGCEKALMKTMGKFGLCTVESYTGGEFFEGNFLDTKNDEILKMYFPNVDSPLGGVNFVHIARIFRNWFVFGASEPSELPSLGLFKEKSDGAGHSYGVNVTKEFVAIADKDVVYAKDAPAIPRGTWILDEHLAIAEDIASYTHGKPTEYLDFGYTPLNKDFIDNFAITEDYRAFSRNLMQERQQRPSALRDILGFPISMGHITTEQEFTDILKSVIWDSTTHACLRNIPTADDPRYEAFISAVNTVFADKADAFLNMLCEAPDSISLDGVQSASEITQTFASGAMSFGALNRNAHEAVALGTNLVYGASNCGEGGEQYTRYNTPKSSSVKQIASGRFGVWAGYFADPNLREIEIKLAQGAKPGEGGQLPSKKVTVEIASMRGGTPMVELVSPPPHHDTYSIEDLAQLIHDAHCARVKVIVKLVSSEGIGTIAIGVAKSGADIINIAGNTGGTGAAQVTSLKNAGRAAEIGIAEVHQALCDSGLRNKVILRNSGAFQNGYDVIKSCILGADSYEFGTTALMMIGCVMAKNCNVKCPAGLTTDPEIFAGDGRALAQYFMNMAHEVREILAYLGFNSLGDIRGRTDLLHLLDHADLTGFIDCRALLTPVAEKIPEKPKYVQACFAPDDVITNEVRQAILDGTPAIFDYGKLHCCNKSVGGQTAIDIERFISWQMTDAQRDNSAVVTTNGKRPILQPDTITIKSAQSAGQSYGLFTTTGMKLIHTGICNDGVAKSMCGGKVVIKNPGSSTAKSVANKVENALIGNFALFGATGGKLFVNGAAGDRFAVRNTGALAVVEGVGDFGCEYMINGTVVNLGDFGKGFGNGMSGGNAYQYDPVGDLEILHSKDSVAIVRLNNGDAQTAYHEPIIKGILQEYVADTDSDIAKKILNNWEAEMGNFYVVNPLAIHQTQCPDYLATHSPAKVITEELLKDYAVSSIRAVKRSYQDKTIILEGEVPESSDSAQGADLLVQFGVMSFAKKRAIKTLERIGSAVDAYMINITAKKLIITEDKDIISDVINALKSDLNAVPHDVLGAWLSQKRIDDYMESLNGRDTMEIYNAGMMEWVKFATKKNQAVINNNGTLKERTRQAFIKNLVKSVPMDTMAIRNDNWMVTSTQVS